MKGKNADMHAIFDELSDTNKDIVILIAKSVKIAQEAAKQEQMRKHASPFDTDSLEAESGMIR